MYNVCMKRISVYLTKAQIDFLKNHHKLNPELDNLTLSEHIRRAIDEYIEKKKKSVSVSLSPSRIIKI